MTTWRIDVQTDGLTDMPIKIARCMLALDWRAVKTDEKSWNYTWCTLSTTLNSNLTATDFEIGQLSGWIQFVATAGRLRCDDTVIRWGKERRDILRSDGTFVCSVTESHRNFNQRLYRVEKGRPTCTAVYTVVTLLVRSLANVIGTLLTSMRDFKRSLLLQYHLWTSGVSYVTASQRKFFEFNL